MFRFLEKIRKRSKPVSSTAYWTRHSITSHVEFRTREESLDYLDWRNSQYLFYEKLMPCNGLDDKEILDYGCGPGNDLVGFVEFSKPKRVVGVDISPSALDEARKRLALHGSSGAELTLIPEGAKELRFADSTFDYIHSSGVLHHVSNIEDVLGEFHRILKPTGLVRIMVYNHDSIWLHLYVAYQRRLVLGMDSGLGLYEAFKRSTDGEDCPISRCYRREEFLNLCSTRGFKARFLGSAISLIEMSMLPTRFEAVMNAALDPAHRSFLMELEFDRFGRPTYRGEVAGIDGVYELTK